LFVLEIYTVLFKRLTRRKTGFLFLSNFVNYTRKFRTRFPFNDMGSAFKEEHENNKEYYGKTGDNLS
jgi:hypothetical protein